MCSWLPCGWAEWQKLLSVQAGHGLPWFALRNERCTEANPASLHLVSTWALLPLQFLLHSIWSALLKWAELGKCLDNHCFHGTMTKIQSGFWRCYYIVTLQIVPDFTCSPVCIGHKSLLPLRIFGIFFVVRSALNIKNKKGKIYHNKLNIQATELLSRTDLHVLCTFTTFCLFKFSLQVVGFANCLNSWLPSRANNCHCHTCSHWLFTFCSGTVLTILSILMECIFT